MDLNLVVRWQGSLMLFETNQGGVCKANEVN